MTRSHSPKTRPKLVLDVAQVPLDDPGRARGALTRVRPWCWLLHIEAVEMSRRARGEHEAVTRAVDEADGVEVCDGVGYFHRSPDFAGQFLG